MEKSKLSLAVLIVGSGVTLIFTIASIAIKKWVTYCAWDFGITEAEPTSDDGDTSSLTDLHDDWCSNSGTQASIESFCPNFCNSLDNYIMGSFVFLVAGSLSLLAQFIFFILSCVKARKQNMSLKANYFFLVIFVLSYLIGFVLYFVFIKPDDISKTVYPAKKWEAKVGVAVGAITSFIMIVYFVLVCMSISYLQGQESQINSLKEFFKIIQSIKLHLFQINNHS